MTFIRLRAMLAEIIALACAGTVFVAAALESPVDSPAVAAPAASVAR